MKGEGEQIERDEEERARAACLADCGRLVLPHRAQYGHGQRCGYEEQSERHNSERDRSTLPLAAGCLRERDALGQAAKLTQ